MALSVVYSNFGGRVVSETRNGVESNYVSDPLGSTIGLMDSAGAMTDRWTYWPYGEVATRTGTNPTPLTFLGVLGYFKDVLDKLFYVRARHLRVDLARWLTVDPLWPRQLPYGYVTAAPTGLADSSGLWPGIWLPCEMALVSVAVCVLRCLRERLIVCDCWAFIDVYGNVVFKCDCCIFVVKRSTGVSG